MLATLALRAGLLRGRRLDLGQVRWRMCAERRAFAGGIGDLDIREEQPPEVDGDREPSAT